MRTKTTGEVSSAQSSIYSQTRKSESDTVNSNEARDFFIDCLSTFLVENAIVGDSKWARNISSAFARGMTEDGWVFTAPSKTVIE